jgi:hypothetical protein
MGRIRTIKPEFFKHEQLYDLEEKHKLPIRLTFAGIWTCCDRAGRFKWQPRQLKADCIPYDPVDINAILNILLQGDFIRKYNEDGKDYGYVPSWEQHQYINNRETESVLPAPPTTGF